MTVIRRMLVVQMVLLLLGLALGATPARAAGTVGGGHAGDCTEANFDTALSGGGLVQFDCGGGAVTILFTSAKNIGVDTIIDGGGLITLSGGNSTRLFNVVGGASLTLKNIVLEKGNSGSNAAGAIFNSGSQLILDHATIQDSHTNNQPGGAIHAFGGAITLTNNSLIQNNNGYNFGAINTNGTLVMDHRIIRDNTSTDAGGGLSLGGLTTISHSQIYSNTAHGADGGGGLYLSSSSRVTIANSQIYSNSTTDNNAVGAGIENAGALTLTVVTVSGNPATGGGAGLYNGVFSSATLTGVTLSGNSAVVGGGINNVGLLTLTDDTLSGNSATLFGAGLFNDTGGKASLTRVTLSGNSASGGGGIENRGTSWLMAATLSGNSADYGGGLDNFTGAATLINTTLSGNSATHEGGGIDNLYSVAVLTNVTFSGNSAPAGGGLDFQSVDVTHTLSLKNTLVANSPSGGNCNVPPGSMISMTSAGFNLSDDDSCVADFNQGGDQNQTPALLFPLANNGGPTLTHLPRHNSPAIDNGTGLGCPATDQRGLSRSGICDIGAVEVQFGDLTWPLFLPMLRR